jgi:uncharacterized membrane protein
LLNAIPYDCRTINPRDHPMTLFATLLPLFCYLLYPVLVERIEKRRPSLSLLMNAQRRRWVTNAVNRDTPLDAILSGNLMGSVSFFASTTVLLILAMFTVFGQLKTVAAATSTLQPHIASFDVEVHIIAVLVMFVLAFLSFTLSLRQFNHFCIMLGAVEHQKSSEEEITIVAALNSLGARSFNNGLRAYYFSIGALTWFLSSTWSIVATLLIVVFLIHREFFSMPRGLVSNLLPK